MKKVLSAVVLSAAVMATAGQAYAYGDFNVMEGARGTLVQILYTDTHEVVINHGNFLTTNNTQVFDHRFTDQNKSLNVVDYKSIFTGLGDTGAVKTAFYIDDMVTPAAVPPNWDVYYATTSATNGGEVPTPLTGTNSLKPFKKFNTLSVNFLADVQTRALQNGGTDVVTGLTASEVSYNNQLSGEYTIGAGSFANINMVSAAFGEAALADYSNFVDMILWGVRHDTMVSTSTLDDVNSSLGQIATLRFNVVTGETILNAAPVPVPAAAWLLGSGVLGLIGLRRRK